MKRISKLAGLSVLTVSLAACADGTTGPDPVDPTPNPPEPDPVILAAGDIGNCNVDGDEQTATLIAGLPGTVLALGDNAYPDGTLEDFTDCYAPSWGAHLGRTRPTPGNHEYHTPDAAGYFGYFGALAGDPALGYYSFDLGAWHLVSLNSNISMSAGSAQEEWLRTDLAASSATCTLAFWHHPRFSSGFHGNSTHSADVVTALDELGADVVLTGHDHHYERSVPVDRNGAADAQGLVHFVAGTGGTDLRTVGPTLPTTAAVIDDSWGVLRLTLADSSYTHEFLAVGGGQSFDGGSADCR